MGYFLAAFLGYLLGCSNLAYYLSRAFKRDIRKDGSGNLGASNATILFGWKAGASVAVHDIGKAVLAVILAKGLFPNLEYAGAAAGVAAVLGHIFPFYLKFKGGKGTASFLGLTLALNWRLALAVILILVLATIITDYIVIGTFSAIVTVPVYMGFFARNLILMAIVCVASFAIFWKHRENIGRMIRREEIGLRSTMRGDKRYDKQ
ncbi:MAG: glycerol-3-phosphate acyltransferase [Oscillospiraceae bacterium]|nr:glycerol-3-phosphate acyltransferase [Oscillospiraceae bacterium]